MEGNTLAYYDKAKNYDHKKFYCTGPGKSWEIGDAKLNFMIKIAKSTI
jgi:hypothetical protein